MTNEDLNSAISAMQREKDIERGRVAFEAAQDEQLRTAKTTFRLFGEFSNTKKLHLMDTAGMDPDRVLYLIERQVEISKERGQSGLADNLRAVSDAWRSGDHAFAVNRMLWVAETELEDYRATYQENRKAIEARSEPDVQLMDRMARERESAERCLVGLKWAAVLKKGSKEPVE